MKVIGVISSPKNNGNTAALVREALEGAKAEGATVTEVNLANYRIEYCNACSKCLAEGTCPIPDDFESLRKIFLEADGIIFSSPTYATTASARIKTLFERFGMLERFTSSLGGKYVAGIAACSSTGAKNVAKYLTILSDGLFQRGYVSGMLSGSFSKGKTAASDPMMLKKANALGRKIALDIKDGRTYPFQNISGRMVNRFLQPMFRNIISQNKDGMLKAVYLNLLQRGYIQ